MEVVSVLYLLFILFHVAILLIVIFAAFYILLSKGNNKTVIEEKDNIQQDFKLPQLVDVNGEDCEVIPTQIDIPNISEEEIFCLEEEKNEKDFDDNVAEEWMLSLKDQLGSSNIQQNSVDIIESNQEKDLLLQEKNTGKKVRNDFISQRIELMRRLEIMHQEDLEKQLKLYKEKKLSEQKQEIDKKEQNEKLSQLNQEDLVLIEKLRKQQSELKKSLKQINSNKKTFNMKIYNNTYLYLKSINCLDEISFNKYFHNLIDNDIKRKKITGVYKLLYGGSEQNNFDSLYYDDNSTDVAISADIEFIKNHFDFIERISCYLNKSINTYLNDLIIQEQSIQIRKKEEIKDLIYFDYD